MEMTACAPLYIRVMGDAWHQLAEPIRCLHGRCSMARAHGRLRITHGRHRCAGFLAWVLRLPRVGCINLVMLRGRIRESHHRVVRDAAHERRSLPLPVDVLSGAA